MAADEGDRAVNPVAQVVGQPGGGIADAGQEQAAGRQRGADPREHRFLAGVVEVMQRVEDGDDIGVAEVNGVHVALPDAHQRMVAAEGAGGAVDVLLHQLDAAQRQRLRGAAGQPAGQLPASYSVRAASSQANRLPWPQPRSR